MAAAVLAVAVAAPVHADPNPWPNIRLFEQLDPLTLTVPGADGLWFTAPSGQNCGIWGPGSFACAGDIPGAPPGTTAVGWVAGDRAVHYDWTIGFRMPKTTAAAVIAPRSSVTHNGTTCAVADDARTYCERGPMKFMIAPEGTWITPPWMDLSRR